MDPHTAELAFWRMIRQFDLLAFKYPEIAKAEALRYYPGTTR